MIFFDDESTAGLELLKKAKKEVLEEKRKKEENSVFNNSLWSFFLSKECKHGGSIHKNYYTNAVEVTICDHFGTEINW